MSNNRILIEVKSVLVQLIDTLNHLNYDEFNQPLEILSNSTIGEHTRHIIEVFQKPIDEYEKGTIDYDNRERNQSIQTNIDLAIECLAQIISKIEKENKPLYISTLTNDHQELIESSYYREIMYVIEHSIHHQAIIKIALISLGKDIVDEKFGLSKSTINYKNKCVQ